MATLRRDAELYRQEFSLAASFIDGRTTRRDTLEWALTVPAGAVREALEAEITRHREEMAEPWRTTWGLVREFWGEVDRGGRDQFLVFHDVETRLKAGELTSSVVSDLARYVRPRLKLEPLNLARALRKPPRVPRSPTDIVRARLTSETDFEPVRPLLNSITDSRFLQSLARALESNVDYGIELGHQLGWDGERDTWRLGLINRVYFVEDGPDDEEPDRFNEGLAPSVKLLHAVVQRLSDLSSTIAAGLVRSWSLQPSPIYRRLWAALSFKPEITPSEEVEAVLTEMSIDQFWDDYKLPEFAELRARRFTDLSEEAKSLILQRIRLGPPTKRWRAKRGERREVEQAVRYWKAREFRRLQLGGAVLPPADQSWLAAELPHFPELRDMKLQHDFPGGVHVYWRQPDPDRSFDGLAGSDRLSALEKALKGQSKITNDPSQRADDWIRADQNLSLLLHDLQQDPEAGASFPHVWERFGWAHTPKDKEQKLADRRAEARKVLNLISRLPESTLRSSIEGVTFWMSTWEHYFSLSVVQDSWFKLWPIAVEATNSQDGDDDDLSISANEIGGREPADLDTLNTPVGRLAGVFLKLCPNLQSVRKPFVAGSPLRKMLEQLAGAAGRSGLIARYRLTEDLGYFLHADSAWATKKLIPPLLEDNPTARVLWRALTRRRRVGTRVLKKLAPKMANILLDPSYGRETRSRILFGLVVEALDSLWRGRRSAMPLPTLQQSIRSVEPELREQAAEAVSRVQKEWPGSKGMLDLTPEGLYRNTLVPFMSIVWPQERSLATPGTSKAFADIPAAAGDEFANAVKFLSRFIVPFDCWSMIDFGLHNDTKRLKTIDNSTKAAALLELLDLSIGTTEGSVVPYGLGAVLQHVHRIAPQLADGAEFRRLSAAARL